MRNLIRLTKNIYSSSSKIQNFVKKITTSHLYFNFTKYHIKYQMKQDLKGPFNLLIETTSYCNASCIMCPHRIMKRPQKVMEDKVFDKIVERLKKEKMSVHKVYLNGFGEPFTDPHFIERVKKLKSLGFKISFYTNASIMTEKIAKQLVDLKVDEVNISFNGVTAKQYQQVMKLDFDKTVKNIEMFLKIKRDLKTQLPVIRISSIITKENESDIKKHFANWEGKVDFVSVSQAHEWGGSVENKSEHKFIKSDRVYPCRSLWHTIAIDANGNFVLCCRDYESQFILGSILENSFADLNKNPVLNKFRKLHLEFNKNKLPKICQNCNFPFQDGVEWYLPRVVS